jgi:hypothetical protein
LIPCGFALCFYFPVRSENDEFVFVVEDLGRNNVEPLNVSFHSIVKVYTGPEKEKSKCKGMVSSNSIPKEDWKGIGNYKPRDLSAELFIQFDSNHFGWILSVSKKRAEVSPKGKFFASNKVGIYSTEASSNQIVKVNNEEHV